MFYTFMWFIALLLLLLVDVVYVTSFIGDFYPAYENCSHTAFEKIYCSKDVVDIELAGYQVITTLVDLMIEAVRYPEKAYSQLLINRVSSQYHIQAPTLYEKIQAVLDYISGMTDVYALDLYRKINGNSLPAL